MALRKPDQSAAAADTTPAGAFESEETSVDNTTPAANEPAAPDAKPAAQPTVASAPRNIPAVVPSTNALANALRKGTALDESQNVIGIEMLETMSIGAFPRITVDQGGFSRNKTEFIGMGIKIELLSWNYVTLITTGEQNDKDADKMIRSSYDHVNIPGEATTVDDYIAKLKEDGYDKTQSKKYVEIYANLLWSEKGGAVAPEDQCMVQLSVSPQSVSQWQRYLLESRMKQAKGIQISNVISIASERKTLNSNIFGIMLFGAKVAG